MSTTSLEGWFFILTSDYDADKIDIAGKIRQRVGAEHYLVEDEQQEYLFVVPLSSMYDWKFYPTEEERDSFVAYRYSKYYPHIIPIYTIDRESAMLRFKEDKAAAAES